MTYAFTQPLKRSLWQNQIDLIKNYPSMNRRNTEQWLYDRSVLCPPGISIIYTQNSRVNRMIIWKLRRNNRCQSSESCSFTHIRCSPRLPMCNTDDGLKRRNIGTPSNLHTHLEQRKYDLCILHMIPPTKIKRDQHIHNGNINMRFKSHNCSCVC